RPLHEAGVLPGRQRLHLVAAEVEVRSRRHRRDLADDVVDEAPGGVVVAERAEADLDAGESAGALPSQVSSGYDDSAAFVCPGMSISGTIVTNRSCAYWTMLR